MDPSRIQLVSETTQYYNQYISLADKKAAILITGHMAFLGLFLQNNSTLTNLLSFPSAVQIIPVIFSSISILFSAFVISPRYKSSFTPKTALGNLNWETVSDMENESYLSNVKEDSITEGVNAMSMTNKALADVLSEKHFWLNHSLNSTLAAVGSVIVAMIANNICSC